MRKAHAEIIEADVALLEAKSDFEVLSERNKTVKERLETMRKEIERLNKIVSEIDKTTKAAHREVAGSLRDAMAEDTELQQFIQRYNEEHPDLSVRSLEEDIEAEKAKLELMHEGDGSIIIRYEERARKIDKIRSHVGRLEEGLTETGGKIEDIKSQWEPELDRLVELISDSFSFNMEQINCAGQVSVYKHEHEFDEWAISIQVKFRENEPLSQLDSHRQSGGERAVSTIFYLMSLQALTRSPFRVVDEINQGMDPRNERLVHARMVAIATGTDDWQPPTALLQPAPGRSSRHGEGGDEDADGIGDDAGPQIHEDTDVEETDEVRARPQMRTGAETGMGTSGAAGSQYFLITPKLLHELKYEEGMRVLCIASGERMEEYANGDARTQGVNLKKALEIRRALNAVEAR